VIVGYAVRQKTPAATAATSAAMTCDLRVFSAPVSI
jgi:hypothetical protein